MTCPLFSTVGTSLSPSWAPVKSYPESVSIRHPRIGYTNFRFSPAYDQRLHSREGILSFGLLDPDNPATWAYDQLIPNDALTVFPHDEDLKAASPSGFRGSGTAFFKRLHGEPV